MWKIIMAQNISQYVFKDELGKTITFILDSISNVQTLNTLYEEIPSFLSTYYESLLKEKRYQKIGLSLSQLFTCKNEGFQHVLMLSNLLESLPLIVIKEVFAE